MLKRYNLKKGGLQLTAFDVILGWV